MEHILPVVIIGIVGGMAVGLQPSLSSLMGQRLGSMESVFIVHLGGAILALLLLLAAGSSNLAQWRTVSWYALGAGVLGVVGLSVINYTIPRVGASTTLILLLAGQLMMAATLDHFGLLGLSPRPIDLWRVIGLAIIFAGVWLMVRP
jgi:transporter family-2 protein